MTIDFTKCVQPHPDTLIRKVGDDAVLLHLGQGNYFGLNAVGARMWDVLVECDSIDAAYAVLLSEFETDADTLRSDVEALIQSLLQHKLIVLEIGAEV